MTNWNLSSWKKKSYYQRPNYDKLVEKQAIRILNQLTPVVSASSVDNLTSLLKKAANGECFLLQGGDCAELFKNCTLEYVTQQIEILQEISIIIQSNLQQPVAILGRIGGQFAKPRSSLIEKRGNTILPGYFGDLINRMEFTTESRQVKPEFMLLGLFHSLMTKNFVIKILRKCKSNGITDNDYIYGKNFFMSHEALLLPYEEALTRKVNGKWYNMSTHFPWIGLRNNDVDGAHVEYMRGISNPIGIKIGPDINEEKLCNLVNILNPLNTHGKIVLIYRLGIKNIESILPSILNSIKRKNIKVLLMCDPMHGNTEKINDRKTRNVSNIKKELENAIKIHQEYGIVLSGIHLEVTGEKVKECVDGKYTKLDIPVVDPRLNKDQVIRIINEVFCKQAHQFVI